jgi:diguanylate cyclase (GGDEF)-like protein/PAS domain S-box-containing protein
MDTITPDPSIPADILLQAIASTNEGVTLADARQPDMPLIYVNPSFERITGFPKHEVIGKNCRFLQCSDKNQPERQIMQRALKQGTNCHVLFRNYKKSGELFWNELNLSPIKNERNEITHYVGIQKDVTRERNYRERIAYLSEHDQLTGLLNRYGFYSHLPNLFSFARSLNRHVVMIALDLDNLKLVNDNYGHGCGDNLIVDFANMLARLFNPDDLIARFGGDEFIVATSTTNPRDLSLIEEKLTRVEQTLSATHPHSEAGCVSYGMVCADHHDAEQVEKLLNLADQRMYQNKKAKKVKNQQL